MMKQTCLSIALYILCAGNASASEATKFSAVDTTKDVAAKQEPAACVVDVVGSSQSKHVYDLPKLAQQLKRLPKILTLKIIQLSETSKVCGIFSLNDADYQKNANFCKGATKKDNYFDEKDITLPLKGRESNDKNVISLYAQLETPTYQLLLFHDHLLPKLARDTFSCFIEPEKLRVSSLNQKVMRSLLQPNKPASATINTQATGIRRAVVSSGVMSKKR